MKQTAALLLLLVSGCSTAPFADLCDFFAPGKISPGSSPGRGGVCAPQPLIPPPNAPGAPAPPSPVFAGPPVPAPPVPGPVLNPPGPPPPPAGGF